VVGEEKRAAILPKLEPDDVRQLGKAMFRCGRCELTSIKTKKKK